VTALNHVRAHARRKEAERRKAALAANLPPARVAAALIAVGLRPGPEHDYAVHVAYDIQINQEPF
jgi:hypothetical protein